MLWKKPAGLRYVDLCIYIDENVPLIATNDCYPDIEDNVYNYLWLLVKALAIKKRMFQNFDDYNGYAFYAARRLYFALNKNYLNKGKIIKGKEIRPIKSCLNYTKTLLYPMKVEYQRETFNEIISEEFVSKKFDAFAYRSRLHDLAIQAQSSYHQTTDALTSVFKDCGLIIDTVLKKSPFQKKSVDYKKLKISLLLNCYNDLKNKKTFDWNPASVILWKLPKSMSSYVKVLVKEFYTALKTEIMECFDSEKLSEDVLDRLVSLPDGDYKEYEE